MTCLVDYKIKNNEEDIHCENIKATYENNELSYKDESDSIKLIINEEDITMIKDNISSETILNFSLAKKTNCQYKIKFLNMVVDVYVLTNKLKIEKNNIYIEYEIWFDTEYSGKFIYELNIKEM